MKCITHALGREGGWRRASGGRGAAEGRPDESEERGERERREQWPGACEQCGGQRAKRYIWGG